MRRTDLARNFGIGESLPEYVRGYMLESGGIVHRLLPQIVPEHLFVQVPKQMERLHADIGALQSALQDAPEVFQTVCVDAPVNITLRMVHNLVREPVPLQFIVGREVVSVDGGPLLDMAMNLPLYMVSATARNYFGANFSATLQHPQDSSF